MILMGLLLRREALGISAVGMRNDLCSGDGRWVFIIYSSIV